MAGSLASINIKFFADLKQFSTQMQNSERQIKKMGRNLTKVGKNLSVGITAPIIAVGGYALKSAADIETMEVSFESMLGSMDKAKQLTEDLINFAANTPFQIEGIGKASKQLLAFGVAEGELLEKLKVLGDISAGANVPLSDMAAIFGKVKAKGKAMTEEILQMSDRGIPIIQVLADKFGVAKSEIFKMAKEGKISFDIVEESLRSMTTEGGIFNDQMAKQSATLHGLASTISDNLSLAFAQLGKDISETFELKELAAEFIKKIQELVGWFKTLSPETKKIIVVVGALVAAIGPLLVALGFLMTSVVPGLITVFTFLSTTALPAVVTGFNAFTAAVLANPIGIVVAAVAALGYALVSMLQSLTPAVSKLKTFLNLIKSGGSAIKFANLQLADEAKAIADEARLKDEASKAAAKFASDQYFAAEATKTLTANLLKQAAAAKTVATPSKARVTGVKSAGVQGGFAIPNFGEDAKLAEGQLEHLKVKMNSFQLAAEEVGYAVGDAFMNLGMNIVDSLGLADDGFQGFAKGLLTTVTKLIAMMLGTSIANSIAGATASGAATGPAAVFTTPAFIATAVGGVLSAFASIPKFATGGIVGGTSYYGDKLLAMVNSGEAILNTDQQKTLYNAVGSGGAVQVPYIADTIISGNDLKIILKRQDKFDNRRS